MPINSKIIEGIIYTEFSDEVDLPLVLQHMDFIRSCRNKFKNHYELHDFTTIKQIHLSPSDMEEIASYGMKTAMDFEHSCIAVYANTDFAFGMARMFEINLELSKSPTIVNIFKNREEAIQFLKDEMNKYG